MPPNPEKIAALQAQLAQLDADELAEAQENATFGDQLSRGIDETEALFGSAAQAVGEAVGYDDLADYGEEVKIRNRQEAEQSAPEGRSIFSGEDKLGGLGDLATKSLPALGVYAGGAATGALTGLAVAGPPGAVVGGLAGVFLSSFGMNVGTIKDIEEMIDPESESSIKTLLYGAGSASLDVITGKGFSATAAAAKQGIKEATKKTIATNVAKNTGTAVGVGVTQIGINTVAAVDTTQTDLTEDRIDAMGDMMGEAAVMNAIMAAPISVASHSVGAASGRAAKFEDEHSNIQFNKETGEAEYMQPNALVHTAPTVFTNFAESLGLGRAVDTVNRTASDNVAMRNFTSQFDMNFRERGNRAGKRTINTEAQLSKADQLQTMDAFNVARLSKKQQAEVKADLVAGKKTEQASKIRAVFKDIRKQAEEVGIKMGDMGETFFPFLPDIKAIRKDVDGFRSEMIEALGGGEGATKKVNDYTQALLGDGAMRLGDEAKPPQWLQESLEAAALGNLSKLKKPLREKSKGAINKRNNLEMHRELSQVPEAQLQKWSKEMDLMDTMEQYIQASTERIEYARRFGADNEKLHETVRLAAVEGHLTEKPLSGEAVDKMYELANLQQRITGTKVTPESRARTAAVKTVMNYKTLPFATIASLMEPLFLAPQVGTKSFIKGGAQALSILPRKVGRSLLKMDIPVNERERIVAEMNTSFRESMRTTAARLGETNIDPTKLDSVLFKYNGLAAWTEFSRTWAQFSAIDSFKSLSNKANNQKLSQRERRMAANMLAEAGLDVAGVRDWMNNGASKDDPYYRQMRAASIDLAEDVIFNPKPANKPIWSSQPSFWKQMFAHLKTFPIQFSNRIALPFIQKVTEGTQGVDAQGNAVKGGRVSPEDAIKSFITASVGVGGFMILDAMKIAAREGSLDRWEEKSTAEKIRGSLAQYGNLGLGIDPVTSPTFGGTPLETIAGPFASTLNGLTENLGAVLTGAKEPEALLEDIVRALPNMGGSRDVLVDAVN